MFVSQAIGTGFAPLASPNFTGVPTAPTAATGTATNQLATTEFVMAAIPALDAGVLSFNGRIGDVTLLANDISAAGGATLNSPVFTGNPTAPSRLPGDSSAALATTAFVTAAIAALPAVPLPSATTPIMNGPPSVGSLATFSRGDHVHPSDTSRLALTGGTLTGALSGTSITASGGMSCGSFQVNNGIVSIFKGTSTNPVIFFNDGSSNRTSFYFDVAGGHSTWTDVYSGANIQMGPANSITLNAGSVISSPLNVSGAASVTSTMTINGLVLSNAAGYLTSGSGFSAPVLRFTGGAGGFLNSGGVPMTGDIANMAFAGAGGSPTGIAFQGTNFANTVAYFVWTDAGSDIRIKQNIAPSEVDALAAVLSIPVRRFDLNPRASDALRGPTPAQRITSYHVPLGLVAQEVMGIIPEMDVVVTQPDSRDPALPKDLHAIVLPNAIPYLIRAIQQLEMRVRELEGATLQ
jgi:hypothetical protein